MICKRCKKEFDVHPDAVDKIPITDMIKKNLPGFITYCPHCRAINRIGRRYHE